MAYVLDTSALIGAWYRSYPPDAFPGVWREMDELAGRGELLVPEEVLLELKRQDDNLHEWVKARAADMVTATNRDVMLAAREILSQFPFLTKSGTGRGLADPFVVALARITRNPVVTEEQGGTGAKPKIPYVCASERIRCMAFLDVVRAEGWRFA